MDKRKVKRIIGIGAICAFIGIGTNIAMATPGGDIDPTVTKSYIDNVVIPQLKEYIDSKLSGLGGGSADGNTAAASAFKIVEVKSGQSLIAGESCEMILRMGSGTIIATEKGGIADTTSGFDLADGAEMPPNHLLIVPLADGRGFIATSDVLVMVKGEYTIN